MKTQFDVLRKSRDLILKEIEDLTLEQLHIIPTGPDELIEAYKKGTVPTKTFTEEEFEEVKELFLGLPDTLEEDYEAGIFEEYNQYPTSTGFVLTSIESAISFNNFHEGIHYGIIRSIKKFL